MIAQEDIVAKSQEVHQVFDELIAVIADAVTEHTPIHKVEGKAMSILLRAGQKAIQLLVDSLGNGRHGARTPTSRRDHRQTVGETAAAQLHIHLRED
jgi:hypothetical protein